MVWSVGWRPHPPWYGLPESPLPIDDFSRMELNVTHVLDSVTDHVQNDVGAHQKWVVR